ncbi:MAG: class I SAM-dependent methyltransferase [Candidatus Paceibacterota bacterium]|jgi:ubiquinone/menaquinone biosynthesis C-methylase UbiE
MKNTNQYDEILSQKYNEVNYDVNYPHRFMIYDTWLEEVGDIKGKKILDLACGAGMSSRALAKLGAEVVGVDISELMIIEARKEEKTQPLGVRYLVGDVSNLVLYSEEPFDMVAAAFLLHYADSREVLDRMVQNIAMNLRARGEFVSLNINPAHPIIAHEPHVSHSSAWLDEPCKDGSRLEAILWTKEGEEICRLVNFYWSKETYEESFKKAGFEKIEWIELRMPEECKGEKDWEHLEKTNYLIIIKATKS